MDYEAHNIDLDQKLTIFSQEVDDGSKHLYFDISNFKKGDKKFLHTKGNGRQFFNLLIPS